MRDENREILDKHSPDEVVGQIVGELMEISDKARAIKTDYVQARRGHNTRALDALTKRLPAVDLPDLIASLTERMIGALVMSFSLAEMALETAEDAIELGTGDDDEQGDDELYDRDEVLRVITEEAATLRTVCKYLESLESLPEEVSAALSKMGDKVKAYDEQLALIEVSAGDAQDEDTPVLALDGPTTPPQLVAVPGTPEAVEPVSVESEATDSPVEDAKPQDATETSIWLECHPT